MKYRVFNTEQEALDAEKAISEARGYSKPGVNAKTGEPVPEAVTTRWAVPKQIQDGRWVFPSPDDEGEEASEEWFEPAHIEEESFEDMTPEELEQWVMNQLLEESRE